MGWELITLAELRELMNLSRNKVASVRVGSVQLRLSLAIWMLIGGAACKLAAAEVLKERVNAPYPESAVIKGVTWHWETHQKTAPGSDLWPVTWAADGNIYAAWGDGGGFGGTDQDGRVAMGFAQIKDGPENFKGENINGGKNPANPASFLKSGKCGGIVAVGEVLYAWV